jgi:hypothetical protein
MAAVIWFGSGFGLPMVGVCVAYKCAIDVTLNTPAGSRLGGFLTFHNHHPSGGKRLLVGEHRELSDDGFSKFNRRKHAIETAPSP